MGMGAHFPMMLGAPILVIMVFPFLRAGYGRHVGSARSGASPFNLIEIYGRKGYQSSLIRFDLVRAGIEPMGWEGKKTDRN